jgi:4'-phosphopantetheinyl transferase
MRLDSGEVHVYDAAIDRLRPLQPDLERTLSDAERERCARYRFPEHSEAFAIRRGLLRALLAGYAGMPAAAVELDEVCATCGGNHGKPRLVGNASLRFSLSHSSGRVLCAFARDAEIGVDIERVDAGRDWAGAARLALTGTEQARLDLLPPGLRARAFFTIWSRKEALAKATGHGLVLPLTEIEVTPAGELLALPEAAGAPDAWLLRDLYVGEAFAAALALRAPTVRVRMLGAPNLRSAAPA